MKIKNNVHSTLNNIQCALYGTYDNNSNTLLYSKYYDWIDISSELYTANYNYFQGNYYIFSITINTIVAGTEIVLNLKELRFSMKEEGPETISFSVQGPCILKGKELNNYLNDFEVLNGSHHIAEITSYKKFDFEMRVQRGRGYSLAKNNQSHMCF